MIGVLCLQGDERDEGGDGMTLNKLIEILQDHAKGANGNLEVRMALASTGATIELRAVQSVQSTPVGVGAGKEKNDHVRLVFRTEPTTPF